MDVNLDDEPVAVAFKAPPTPAEKIIPLSLAVFLFALDQAAKFLVEKLIPPYSAGVSLLGDFLRIIHVKNTGVAFSIGVGLPDPVRRLVFAFIPLAVLIIVLVVYFRSKDFTPLQRWAIAGITGGGFGNLFDRFFRQGGVVDFIDFKFFGIFGFDRWPTFNVADMSVLISGCVLLCSIVAAMIKEQFPPQQEQDSGAALQQKSSPVSSITSSKSKSSPSSNSSSSSFSKRSPS